MTPNPDAIRAPRPPLRARRGALGACLLAFLALLASCAGGPGRQRNEEERSRVLALYPPDAPFENSSFVEIQGSRLHLRRWAPAGPPGGAAPLRGRVLLVHGLAGSAFGWRFLGPSLSAAGYEAASVEYPPFGWSEGAPGLPASAQARAELLWALVDRLGGGRWHLVGHSLGGRIVSFMALARPESTASLILVAPAVEGRSGGPGLASIWPVSAIVESQTRAALGDRERIRGLLKGAYGRAPSEGELDGYWASFIRPGAADAFLSWSRASSNLPAADREGPRLEAVPSPALVVWGEKDGFVEEAADRVAARIGRDLPGARPAERLVLPGEGHCVMETAPGPVDARILAFLAELD